jgi:hypothetical protein
VLSGDTDGWVPTRDALTIKAAAPDRVELERYRGLGHALNPVASRATDTFGVTANRPVEDIIDWTTRRSR